MFKNKNASHIDERNCTDIYDTDSYRRSRKAYIFQAAFEYLISILVSDVFLAKLLASIGIKDSLIGIISSFVSVAFLFQLLTVFLARRIVNVKRTAMFFSTLAQLLFMSLFLVPFMPLNLPGKTTLVVVCILSAYLGNYFVSSLIYKWANSFVAPGSRGEYSAVKEVVSLVCGMVFTLVVGYVIDRYDASGNIEGGFLFIAAAIFILCIFNFLCFFIMKNSTASKTDETNAAMREVIKNTLGNKSFVNVIIFTVMWNVAIYMTVGFLGTFKTKDLMISVGTIQIINIAANLCRIPVSKPFGRYSDRHSFAGGIKVGFCIAAAAFAVNIFTMPETRWLIIIYTVLYSIGMAGINQNMSNITYSYVKSEYFVQAHAIKNSIGGICGFCASLVGSRILAYVQANNNTLFGIRVYGQQILSAISFCIIVMAIIFVHKVVDKQAVLVQ